MNANAIRWVVSQGTRARYSQSTVREVRNIEARVRSFAASSCESRAVKLQENIEEIRKKIVKAQKRLQTCHRLARRWMEENGYGKTQLLTEWEALLKDKYATFDVNDAPDDLRVFIPFVIEMEKLKAEIVEDNSWIEFYEDLVVRCKRQQSIWAYECTKTIDDINRMEAQEQHLHAWQEKVANGIKVKLLMEMKSGAKSAANVSDLEVEAHASEPDRRNAQASVLQLLPEYKQVKNSES